MAIPCITSKNLVGWLKLGLKVVLLPKDVREKVTAYVRRRDKWTRQKELDNILGDEIWWI